MIMTTTAANYIKDSGIKSSIVTSAEKLKQTGDQEKKKSLGLDFNHYLHNALERTGNSLKTAESTTMQSLDGKVSPTQLVLDLQEAELKLHTMTVIHGKGIEAYKRITQMQI